MSIDQFDYMRDFCPGCGSPRINEALLMSKSEVDDHNTNEVTAHNFNLDTKHWHCQNCNRIFPLRQQKRRLDRKQVRRDIKTLQKLLEK